MGNIEDARGELVGLGNAVESYVQDTIAAADQERFTSLPERLNKASSIAQELGQLLSGVIVDLRDYSNVMLPYTTANIHRNPESIPLRLEQRAKIVAEQYGNERMAQLPELIDDMGLGPFSGLIRIGPQNANYIKGYVERLKTMAERTTWLAKKFEDSWGAEPLAEQMNAGYEKVKRTIANPGL